MHIKIQTRERDQRCQRYGRNAEFRVSFCQNRCADHRRQRVPGREGEVRWVCDKKRDALIYPAGARTGDQRLENNVARQYAYGKSGQQKYAVFSVFFRYQQRDRSKQPDGAAVSSSVILGMRKSMNGQTSALCIQCRIVQSKLMSQPPFRERCSRCCARPPAYAEPQDQAG